MNTSYGSLNVKQAAQFLGLSVSWVYKRTASGEIPHLKIGKAVRFDPAELEKYRAQFKKEVL